MIHHQVKSCESTQEVLRTLYMKAQHNPNETLLVSTEEQTAGRGRHGQKWVGLKHALYFSFSIKANEATPTLTSLEVGLALSHWLNQNGANVTLKWPNDLLNERGEKVGGVLLQGLSADVYACGIGINWVDPDNDLQNVNQSRERFPAGVLFMDADIRLSDKDKHDIAAKITESVSKTISEYRKNSNFNNEWNEACSHLNQEVEIRDGTSLKSGTFVGIGPLGEALLKDQNNKIIPVFTGSLFKIED